MATSQAITDFQLSCQQYFICYFFAATGIWDHGKKLASNSPNHDAQFFLGTGHPNEGHLHAAMKIREAIDSSQPNGAFADKIAKSFIVAIYSEWDEVYRHRLAAEASANSKLVRCDLMGDLRLIRHCIVHNKSMITDEHKKLKELKWQLSPGVLKITKDMFSLLVDQINAMIVRVEPDSSPNTALEPTPTAP